MRDVELTRRAEALGVSTTYVDWRGRRVRVGAATLRAIAGVLDEGGGDLAVLDRAASASTGAGTRAGTSAGTSAGTGAGTSAGTGAGTSAGTGARPPEVPRIPGERLWGFTVQLYSVRSARSWGHGDLRDLAELAAWSARELGAGFILVNPLHAAEPAAPVSASPYLPMTRRFSSPLYLRIEDIPEYGQLPAADRERIDRLAAPLRAASSRPDLIDRDAVWTAKLTALELIHQIPRSAGREAEFRAFTEREGSELAAWGIWCALAERHGADWRDWPAGPRDPGAAARLAGGDEIPPRAIFHIWLQWLFREQLAAAQRAAVAAGMPVGIIADLAVGVHPGGADAWARQDLLVSGMTVGAPPDGFNQFGQDWAQPPLHPRLLAAEDHAPLAGLFRAACRGVGGIRVDHVMGLMRLWWVPAGMTPDHGAYVRYDHHATVGALAREAARAGAIAIGEDLGTVAPWIRRYLGARGIMGTEMSWFACEPDGSPLLPGHWRRRCVVTVGTHDVPPVASFLSGDQVTVRERLGLLRDPEAEKAGTKELLEGWRAALAGQGLLRAGQQPSAADFTVALYGYLARTRSLLIGVSLADAVGDRRAQNIPGTSDEYPNWRIPLCDGSGSAVLIEDLAGMELVRAVARAAGARHAS